MSKRNPSELPVGALTEDEARAEVVRLRALAAAIIDGIGRDRECVRVIDDLRAIQREYGMADDFHRLPKQFSDALRIVRGDDPA
jgi:hypothetical protein